MSDELWELWLLQERRAGARPRLLDLFCKAGGAGKGYHDAGFDVVGVDIEPQPNYPFEFIQADALTFPLAGFDVVHASPPCQGYTSMNRRFAEARDAHPRLIADMRDRLRGVPSVIENVPGARAELNHPIVICGRAFGLGVGRHRLFECSFPALSLQCQCNGFEVPVYGKLDGRRLWTRKDGSELRAASTLGQAQAAMGVDWMTWDELREAIPPAYTEFIGSQLLVTLEVEAAA